MEMLIILLALTTIAVPALTEFAVRFSQAPDRLEHHIHRHLDQMVRAVHTIAPGTLPSVKLPHRGTFAGRSTAFEQ
jgi:hypothetical protein